MKGLPASVPRLGGVLFAAREIHWVAESDPLLDSDACLCVLFMFVLVRRLTICDLRELGCVQVVSVF